MTEPTAQMVKPHDGLIDACTILLRLVPPGDVEDIARRLRRYGLEMGDALSGQGPGAVRMIEVLLALLAGQLPMFGEAS